MGYNVQAGKYLIFNIDEMLVKILYKTPFLIHITRIIQSTYLVNFEREVLDRKDVKKDRMFKLCWQNKPSDWQVTQYIQGGGGAVCVTHEKSIQTRALSTNEIQFSSQFLFTPWRSGIPIFQI